MLELKNVSWSVDDGNGKNDIERAYNNPIFFVLPIDRSDIDTGRIIRKAAPRNNFICTAILTGDIFAEIIPAKSFFIGNAINGYIITRFILY